MNIQPQNIWEILELLFAIIARSFMKSTYPTYNPSEEYFIEYRNLLKLKNEKDKRNNAKTLWSK